MTVYFIVAKALGRVKIGSSDAPSRRVLDCQTGSPDELVVVATQPGGANRERALHAQFQSARLFGEWFRLTDDLREEIERSGGRIPDGVGCIDSRDARALHVMDVAVSDYEEVGGEEFFLSGLVEQLGKVVQARYAASADLDFRDYPRMLALEELAAAALGWANVLSDRLACERAAALTGMPAEEAG